MRVRVSTLAALTLTAFTGVGMRGRALAADPPPMTMGYLHDQLVALPMGAEADQLAEGIRAYFGAEAMKKGVQIRIDGLEVGWAIDAEGAKGTPEFHIQAGPSSFPNPGEFSFVRVGGTSVYAAAMKFPDDAALHWNCTLDGQPRGEGNVELHIPDPDAIPRADVPKGQTIEHINWKSKVFPGTERDWWVYVPAQFKPTEPARVMVFQDGGGMKGYATVALDNLIAKEAIPVMVGVFINPGHVDPALPKNPNELNAKMQRSFEYDTLSAQYANFLLDEILPEVEKTIPLRHDPASRGVCGISSGGICSWTVAWQRPAEFGKVLSFVGSFTNIASGPSLRDGGHNYPALIRKVSPKPIRVYLQDGENDLDNEHGNWFLANQEMAKALAFAGYDYKVNFGKGFHSDAHARAILPEALRWLWRE